ncbi:MAG: DUF1934 domain-containing protein [Clostridia bacterium]|nr:DUF1934 domain-containing protein [Clostridia bacterium]
MKIPVDIRIRRERIGLDSKRKNEIEDSESYSLSGVLKKSKNGFRLEFNESLAEVFTTVDMYSDGTVSINRVGPINTHMVFSEERAYTCICNTGFTPFQLNVRTSSLENGITFDGGILDIRYSVEIHGNLAEKCRIVFSVSPDISIIRS